MGEPLSRVEAILQNILGADNILVPPGSQVEEILQAIYYNTEYENNPKSRVAEILLAIKNKGIYDGPVLSRMEDILIHKLNDKEYTDYSEDDLSRVEKLLIQWIDLHPEVIKELTTSSFPISILANGLPLIDYRIYGNTVQNGTPTPDSPIEPEFVGGSTALPYEPYGYKIPISSAGQTKNIYLGQVQTTRRIKKMVLTGEENFRRASNGCFYWTGGITDYSRVQNVDMCRCTHFGSQPLVGGTSSVTTNNIAFYHSTVTSEFYCAARNISSADDFKAYLATQYANGTPVIVWYVLATPETGIVNEPLARIGDYADSVDFSQAGVEMPTLKKPNTTVIDVETEVEPSSMYLKYTEQSDGPAPKTPVLGTKDREIYVTPNNEVYVLRR